MDKKKYEWIDHAIKNLIKAVKSKKNFGKLAIEFKQEYQKKYGGEDIKQTIEDFRKVINIKKREYAKSKI